MSKADKKQSKTIVHPATINLLVDSTWAYAHQVLWNDHPFTREEILQAKAFILEYYESIPSEKFHRGMHHYFAGYCIRVQMAREYVLRKSYRYIPHPCIWLNKRNKKGFAGTKSWYDSFILEQHYANKKFRPQDYSKTA